MYNETPIRCFRFLNPRISLKRLAFKFENQIKNIYYSRKTVCFFLESLPLPALVFIRNVCSTWGEKYLPHYLGQWRESTAFSKMSVLSPLWAQQTLWVIWTHTPTTCSLVPAAIPKNSEEEGKRMGWPSPVQHKAVLRAFVHFLLLWSSFTERVISKEFALFTVLETGKSRAGPSLLGALWRFHSVTEEVKRMYARVSAHESCLAL